MANNFPMAARLKPKTTVGLKFSCSPNYESACDVIFNKLKISEKDIRGFQNIPNNRVAVKFIEEKVFDVFIREYEDKVIHFGNGEKALVVNLSSVYTYVSIRYAHFDIEDSLLISVLEQYGKVLHLRHNTFSHGRANGLENGTRTVKMEIKKNIPSSINICGYNVVFLYNGQKKTCYKCGRDSHMAVNCNMDSEPKLNIFNLNDFPAMPGKDSDKGRISEEDGTPDVQLATSNEANVEQPCDGKSIENDKEESSNHGEDQIGDLCEAVGEQLVTIPSSKNVDDVAVHQHSVEIEGRSCDLAGHVPGNGDNLTDTDSDSDIFAIKSAPEGASQVTEITEDKGLPSQDEPRIPYTVESLFPVEDDVNEEPGNLKEINIAVSVHRDDESVDGATEERDMDIEVNKVSDIEDDLKNYDKGSDVMPKGQWNIDLDTVGKLKLIRGKSNKEKRKEEK
ncbi:uncharacterized protein [Palaemon carinicauda]|uniref:uncharacterized protein n=1 Tax=Palaemon carinicauda TaxID=392227 RepID=UPI0035B671EC